MRLVRRAAPALVLVTALGLAGCSGGDDSATTDTSASEQATEEAQEESGPEALTTEDFMSRIVAAQVAAGSTSMSSTTEAGGQTITTTADTIITASSQNARMTIGSPTGESIEVRLIDGMIYVNLGEPSENKFIQVDPSDPADPLAAQFAGVTSGVDPSQSLRDLEPAVVSVEPSGEPEEVDGVQTQAYDVTIDTSKVGGATAEQFASAGTSLPAQIDYRYWIDEDDLVRKVTTEVMGTTTEILFTSWGADLDVSAPGPDEITEMTF